MAEREGGSELVTTARKEALDLVGKSVARTDPPLRAHSISEKQIAAIVGAARPSHNPLERAASVAAALDAQLLPAAPVKLMRPVPAQAVQQIQQVAANDVAAERAAVTAAPTGRRNVLEMSNRQIVSEVYNLHEGFQQLLARYEKAGTVEERVALRDQMRPIVHREGELREGYLSRITQEIRREGAAPRVGENRRIMEPKVAVANVAVAR